MNNKLILKVTGKTKKYFLNEIIKNNINIYDLKEKNNSYELLINYSDYEKILNIKTTNKIDVIQRIGINNYLNFIKTNIIVIIFVTLGILLNILLSNMILDIEINHPNKEIKKIIKKDLKEFGITKYKFKISYKEKDIIDWLEIEEKGTKYIIKLEERKKEELVLCNPRNIISTKEAIITKITSESGEIKKKINDYVVPGDILISGVIYNKETAVDKRCAVGKVYGETWYKVKVILDNNYKTIEETTNKRKGLYLKVFNLEYKLFNKFSKYKIKEYNIIKSKILPINISFVIYEELLEKNNKNTLDNVDGKALEIAEKNIKNKLSNDESILTKKVLKKELKNSKIEVDVFISTEENIIDYQDITDLNINELNKE